MKIDAVSKQVTGNRETKKELNMINRHNYEEFFLMYVDNELTTQQRTAVELFVRQNPDLQSEFDMLQQTKLPLEEEIMFAHKTDLLKIKDSIGIDNYQEYFLLYIDNELNEESKEAVEKFVLQHPQLQDEFTLLKQTVLPHEKIVFTHKKLLYRKEVKRVIPIFLLRIAAAAAVAGVAVLIWWLMPGAKQNEPIIAKQTVQPTNIQKPKEIPQAATKEQQKNNEIASTPKTQNEKVVEQTVARRGKEKKPMNEIVKHEQRQKNNDANNFIASNNKKDNSVKSSSQDAKNNKQDNNTAIKDNEIIASIPNENPDPIEKSKSTNAMQQPNPEYRIQTASYKELNTNDDDNRNAFYIGNMEVNKNKVRGIIKKVGGLFSGKSKNSSDDEKGKLQVANFELNTN